jgi:cell division protein FtsL
LVVTGQIRAQSREFSRHVDEVTPRRRRAKDNSRDVTLVSVLAALLVLFAMAITARQAAVAHVGYQIVALRKDLASVQAEYQQLEVTVSRLQSFDRIEAGAARLGMQRPSELRLVYADTPVEKPAVQVAASDAGEPAFRQFAAMIASAWQKVSGGVMGAEARNLK